MSIRVDVLSVDELEIARMALGFPAFERPGLVAAVQDEPELKAGVGYRNSYSCIEGLCAGTRDVRMLIGVEDHSDLVDFRLSPAPGQ